MKFTLQKGIINKYHLLMIFVAILIPLHNIASKQAIKTMKEFEIIIPSFNNASWAELNLYSVCFQNYPRNKYHVTYINDASTDETEKIVTEFIKTNHLADFVTLVNRTMRKGTLENRYRTIHNLPDDRIVVECDGDDFFENTEVLATLNEIYQNPNTWMLYTTKYKAYPENKIVEIRPFTQQEIAHHSFRNFRFRPTMQLRSYYAWLFKQVKLKDLLYKRHFYTVLTDPAYMIPMLEMAGTHNFYVPQVLYIRNNSNPLNISKITSKYYRHQIYNDISNKKPYPRIKNHTAIRSKKLIPEVVLCASNEVNLKYILATIQDNLIDIKELTVLLETTCKDPTIYHNIHDIEDNSINIKIICLNKNTVSLQAILQAQLKHGQSDYMVLFFDENIQIKHHITITECLNILVDSSAQALLFYPCLSWLSEEFACVQLSDSIWASQIKYSESLYRRHYEPKSILCSKKLLTHILNSICCNNVKELIEGIRNYHMKPADIYLFYEL